MCVLHSGGLETRKIEIFGCAYDLSCVCEHYHTKKSQLNTNKMLFVQFGWYLLYTSRDISCMHTFGWLCVSPGPFIHKKKGTMPLLPIHHH